jgi:hypothetical protein
LYHLDISTDPNAQGEFKKAQFIPFVLLRNYNVDSTGSGRKISISVRDAMKLQYLVAWDRGISCYNCVFSADFLEKNPEVIFSTSEGILLDLMD